MKRRKLTTLELKRIWAQQSNLCANCENELDETAQLDHMWALELGGPDHPANIRAVCPNCHARKTLRDNWLKRKREAYNRRMEKEMVKEKEKEKVKDNEDEEEKRCRKRDEPKRSAATFLRMNAIELEQYFESYAFDHEPHRGSIQTCTGQISGTGTSCERQE